MKAFKVLLLLFVLTMQRFSEKGGAFCFCFCFFTIQSCFLTIQMFFKQFLDYAEFVCLFVCLFVCFSSVI